LVKVVSQRLAHALERLLQRAEAAALRVIDGLHEFAAADAIGGGDEFVERALQSL
jgi:hypothetical protein